LAGINLKELKTAIKHYNINKYQNVYICNKKKN